VLDDHHNTAKREHPQEMERSTATHNPAKDVSSYGKRGSGKGWRGSLLHNPAKYGSSLCEKRNCALLYAKMVS
jgi:hypothetical protein